MCIHFSTSVHWKPHKVFCFVIMNPFFANTFFTTSYFVCTLAKIGNFFLSLRGVFSPAGDRAALSMRLRRAERGVLLTCSSRCTVQSNGLYSYRPVISARRTRQAYHPRTTLCSQLVAVRFFTKARRANLNRTNDCSRTAAEWSAGAPAGTQSASTSGVESEG